ncbi:unnamed protein product [Somion occarium]|uniref:Small ribosomal subunit protein mS41 n=1 Tax=Somion occarium TaxID=3059160 RepID=A0ABP1DZU6_9APHY
MSSVLAFRLQNPLPQLVRTWVNKAQFRPVPPPRCMYPLGLHLSGSTEHVSFTIPLARLAGPTDFLKAIGRSSETKFEAPATWEEFWKVDGNTLKKAGVPVQDRRYILWSMQKYRMGENPEDFAHAPTPKKKIRGRGPAVQLGKRIRSRRLR